MPLLLAAAKAGNAYGLAVLDSQMPSLSCIDLARTIRATPALGSISVVMISALGSERGAAVDAGVDGFVAKPIRRTRLFDELAQVLDPGRSSATTGVATTTVPERSTPEGPLVLLADDNQINQRWRSP